MTRGHDNTYREVAITRPGKKGNSGVASAFGSRGGSLGLLSLSAPTYKMLPSLIEWGEKVTLPKEEERNVLPEVNDSCPPHSRLPSCYATG